MTKNVKKVQPAKTQLPWLKLSPHSFMTNTIIMRKATKIWHPWKTFILDPGISNDNNPIYLNKDRHVTLTKNKIILEKYR